MMPPSTFGPGQFGRGVRVPARIHWPAAAAAALFAACALGLRVHLSREVLQTEVHTVGLQEQLRSDRAASDRTEEAAPDFVQRLPILLPIEPTVSQLQRSGAAWNVAVESLAVSGRDPTLQTLGRTQLTITLRGSYLDLKSVLAQTFDRNPQQVLQRLTLRRVAAPTEIEARVDLLLVTRPLPVAGPNR